MESRLARSDNGWFTPVQFVDYGAERFRRISCSVNPRTGAPRPLVDRGEPWGLVQREALARIDRVRLTGEGQSSPLPT